MTTLILQSAGSALGGLAGGPIGAGTGRVLGGLAGAALDNALFGGPGDAVRPVEGPRLKDIDGLTSTEGAPIPRVYGRARVGGQLIWATRFEEVANATAERSGTRGGKSLGGGGASSGTSDTTTYSYFANLAVGLCEGPIAFVRRVWADGRELDLTTLTMRVHRGDESQPPDPLIVAKEGAENAPAYRGLAYVAFERLPLAEFGNRVPQFSFEVVRARRGPWRHDPRRVPDPRRERVRLRRCADFAVVRPWGDAARKPPPASGGDRCGRLARCLAGVMPEPEARFARGELVRRRPARRPLHDRAARGERGQESPMAIRGPSPGSAAPPRGPSRPRTACRPTAARRPTTGVDAADPGPEGARA